MKYYVEDIAGNYLKNLADVPKMMIIHPSCLCGTDKEQFQEGFYALQQLVRRLYADIIKDPSGFGMLLKENVEPNAKSSNYTLSNLSFVRIPNLLFVLGTAGTLLPEVSLEIKGERLLSSAKELKITNLSFLLKKLCEYGFEMDGAIKDGAIVNITYPGNRCLVAALKAMADAQLRLNKGDIKKSKNYFYMLHSGLVENEPVKAPRLSVDMVLHALGDEQRKIAADLHEAIASVSKATVRMGGFMRNDWSCVYKGKKSGKVLMRLDVVQDRLSAKLNLQHIGQYINTVMTYPENIRNVIRSSGWECGHCHDSCAGGFAYIMEGQSYNKCRCSAFLFDNISADEIPYCKELLSRELEYEDE